MSEGRRRVLGAIRRALRRRGGEGAGAVDEHLREHPRGPVPARDGGTHAERVALFAERARAVESTVTRVASSTIKGT